jgi:hypothetical protein
MAKVTVEEAFRNIRKLGLIFVHRKKPDDPVVRLAPRVEDKPGFGIAGGSACPASVRASENRWNFGGVE